MSGGAKVCLDPGLWKVRLADIAYQTDVQRGHMTSLRARS